MNNTVTSQEGAVQQPPSISVQDLQALLMAIDLASSRGAYRGPELSQVGHVFDKLNQFLKGVLPANDSQTPQPVPQPVMPMTPPFSPKIGG